MPYIEQGRQYAYRQHIEGGNTPGAFPHNAGELNYVLTDTVDDYILASNGPNYAKFNEVIGVLEAVKLELYRRVVSVYEDEKLAENGDVYYSRPDA